MEVLQNLWTGEDFDVKESVVCMKEVTQARAVDCSLCAQNALPLVCILPLILNVKGFLQIYSYFVNRPKYCDNLIQFHFKSIHKHDVMLVVSFILLHLTSASWEMFYLAAV